MKLLWLDLETTGLDPRVDVILEVAAALADFETPFHARLIVNEVCYFDPEKWIGDRKVPVHERVFEMHSASGLWRECCQATRDDVQIERTILRSLDALPAGEKILLAGSGAHFDRSFLKAYMPTLESRLYYRHYDVRSVDLFFQSLGMGPVEETAAHRALADLEQTIRLAQRRAVSIGKVPHDPQYSPTGIFQ